MSRENTAGLGIYKKYGPETQSSGGGVVSTYGSVNDLVWHFGADAELNTPYQVALPYKSVNVIDTVLFDSSGGVGGNFTINIRTQDGGLLATENISGGNTTTVTLTTIDGPQAGQNTLVFEVVPTLLSLSGQKFVKFRIQVENLTGLYT